RKRVIVAGGGFAGLEATLALHHLAGELIELTMVAPEPDFVYRPFAVEEPFTQRPPEQRALAPILAELGWEFRLGSLARVDAGAHRIETAAGESLAYDALIVCIGARARPAYERARTLTTRVTDAAAIDELLRDGRNDSEDRIAFVAPPGGTRTLPAYEPALLARRRAEDLAVDPELVVFTPEDAPLDIFGPIPSATVERLLEARRIEVRTGVSVIEGEDGFRLVPDRAQLEARAVVALPLIDG